MRIIIIDDNNHRCSLIAEKLKRLGIVDVHLNPHRFANDARSVLKHADLVLLLDSSFLSPTYDNLLSDLNQNARVITILNSISGLAADNQIIYCNEKDTNQEFDFIGYLVHQIKPYFYHELMSLGSEQKQKLLVKHAMRIAKSHASVLICGETGSGKEVLANYIHHHSLVKNGPFISVNCAAMPESMIEAMLFGYEKGAFTNAIRSYAGKFEQAHHGTLLLDEISEIPIHLQAKLLRVIQEKEIERIGGKKPIEVDVRIIATSNRDLLQSVQDGEFRQDLYYRLDVVSLHCIPLRERRSDILPLALYFSNLHSKQLDKEASILSESAKEMLITHNWPGNIRELDNVIHRAVILDNDNQLDIDDILLNHAPLVVNENSKHFQSKLEMNEAIVIMDTLREMNGSRSLAARELNMSPRTLRYKLSKLKSIGINVP